MDNDLDTIYSIWRNLPNALPKEEFDKYFKLFKQGDLKAREKLISHNMRLVYDRVFDKYKTVEYEKSDLISMGMFGLISAVDTFDIEKGYEFSTYATRCIDHAIGRVFLKLKKQQDDISIEMPLSTTVNDSDEFTLLDFLYDIDDDLVEDLEKKDLYSRINNIINELEEKEKIIVKMYFGFDNDRCYTYKEIANELNLSEGYVYEFAKKTILKLKNVLQEDFGIKSNKRTERKIKSIYQLLSDYTEEEIDLAIKKLPGKDKRLLYSKYGYDLKNPKYFQEVAPEVKRKIRQSVIPKLKKCLASNYRAKYVTLYDYFNNNTKEEVDLVISFLPDNEKEIIRLKFGDDFENPVTSEDFDEEAQEYFRSRLLDKIKRILIKVKENIENAGDDYDLNDIVKNSMKPRRPGPRKTKSLYALLSDYTEEEVDLAIKKLSGKDKRLLFLRYGEDLKKPKSGQEVDEGIKKAVTQTVMPKLRRILETDCSLEFVTIYDYFKDFTKEEIDLVISNLREDDKKILRLKYGEDFENPFTSVDFDANDENKFKLIIAKIRKVLLKVKVNVEKTKENYDLENIVKNSIKYHKPRNSVSKEIKSLYVLLNKYTKEEIDKEVSRLCYDERVFLESIYTEGYDKADNISFNDYNDWKRFDDLIQRIEKKLCERPDYTLLYSQERINKVKEEKSIYQILNLYKKEDIDYAIERLSFVDKEIIRLKYNTFGRCLNVAGTNKFFHTVIPRIQKIIEDKDKEKKSRKTNTNTIYDAYEGFTKEEIDEVLESLSDSDKELLKLRYGDNLEEPVVSKDYDAKAKDRFNKTLIPKIRRMLMMKRNGEVIEDNKGNEVVGENNNLYGTIDDNRVFTNIEDVARYDVNIETEEEAVVEDVVTAAVDSNISETDNDIEINKNDMISIDDFIGISDFIKRFNVFDSLNKETMIISLKLGFINNKYYSNEAIANFLGISEEEVIKIVKDGLILYKNKINNLFDNFSNILLENKEFERR